MLDTVFNTRAMEFIPQLAEPAVRLHLLVVDADAAVRSACAEIAASLGYAVESTGRPGPGAQPAARPHRRHPAGQPARGVERGPGAGLRGQAALSRHLGHRHDRYRLGERGRRGHALRRLGLPDQALRHGRAVDGARPRRAEPHDRHRDPPVARAAAPLRGAGLHDRPLGGDGEDLPHPLQGRPEHAPGADSGRERNRQGTGGAHHPRLRPQLRRSPSCPSTAARWCPR